MCHAITWPISLHLDTNTNLPVTPTDPEPLIPVDTAYWFQPTEGRVSSILTHYSAVPVLRNNLINTGHDTTDRNPGYLCPERWQRVRAMSETQAE